MRPMKPMPTMPMRTMRQFSYDGVRGGRGWTAGRVGITFAKQTADARKMTPTPPADLFRSDRMTQPSVHPGNRSSPTAPAAAS